MAADENSKDAAEQIAQIRREFERAENAGDSSVVDRHCAEDIVAMPPGQPPATGKAAAREALDALFAAFDLQVEYTSEEVVVGDDLAFDRLRATEIHVPKDGGEPIEHTADSLWVYRRSPEGEWKQILAIWNYRD